MAKHPPKQTFSELRIVGGKWRGRKIQFPCIPGLRPTPDRVRETLFNWLSPVIMHARCLDLFAGSGALGVEALSRGASEVIFIDESLTVVQALLNNLSKLSAENALAHQKVFSTHLHLDVSPFDIIFLDPPFHQGLLASSCNWLETQGLVKSTSLIYLETELSPSELLLPPFWEILRQKKAGKVFYYLAHRMEKN